MANDVKKMRFFNGLFLKQEELTLEQWRAVVDTNLLADAKYGPATIPSLYITAIAHAPRGGWPLAVTGSYDDDADHLRDYMKRAATPEGFQDYLREHVLRAPVPA